MSYVTNPLTGRPVAIGSTVYKRLVKQQLIEDNSQDFAITPRNPPANKKMNLIPVVKKIDKPEPETKNNVDEDTYNKIVKITEKTINKLKESGATDDTEFDDDEIEELKNIVLRKYKKRSN